MATATSAWAPLHGSTVRQGTHVDKEVKLTPCDSGFYSVPPTPNSDLVLPSPRGPLLSAAGIVFARAAIPSHPRILSQLTNGCCRETCWLR